MVKLVNTKICILYHNEKKRNEVLIHVVVQMNLEDIILSERSQTQNLRITSSHLNAMSRRGRSIVLERRLVVAQGRTVVRFSLNERERGK